MTRKDARTCLVFSCLLLAAVCAPAPASAAQQAFDPTERDKPLDEIVGVRIGLPAGEARLILDKLGTRTRESGPKESWQLRLTPFEQVTFEANAQERVERVTGVVRSDQLIPFHMLGPISRASSSTDKQVIWKVERSDDPYTLIVKGHSSRAMVLTLVALDEATIS